MNERTDAPYAAVVDDNAIILMDATDILENAGFRVLMANNGDEAMQHLEKHGADVVLLFTDVEMPGSMNGFELAQQVNQRWPDIAILVASGQRKPEEGDLPEGALFVGKPFSSKVIHARVHEILPNGRKPEPLKRMVSNDAPRS